MKAEWYAQVDGQEYGPYTWQQMLQMAAEGRVPADLPVRRAADKRWFAARQVPGLVKTGPAAKAETAATPAVARPAKDDSHLKRAKPLNSAGSAGAAPVPPPAPPPRAAAVTAADSPWPVIVTEGAKGVHPPGTTAAHPSAAHPHHGKKNPLLLVGILTGTALIVLLAGGIGAWAVWFRSPSVAGTQAAAVAATQQDLAPEGASGSSATDKEAGDRASGSGPTKSALAAQEKVVKSISSWQSLAGLISFGVSNANLQVTRVWRAPPAAEGDAKAAGQSRICVEVSIRNKSTAPLLYKGWNSFGEHGAILADEAHRVLPLVPAAETPEIKRLSRTSVPGGGVVTETLVFAAPASEEEVLHLVLPYSVFYSNARPPHRAIELTPDILGVDLAAGKTPLAARSAAETEPLVDEPATTTAPPATGVAKSDTTQKERKPESLRDIINNDRTPPAKPDDMPAKGEKGEKGKDAPKKPENPFEPKEDAE